MDRRYLVTEPRFTTKTVRLMIEFIRIAEEDEENRDLSDQIYQEEKGRDKFGPFAGTFCPMVHEADSESRSGFCPARPGRSAGR